MTPFVRHDGVVAPLMINNVDTDQIIPSREMRRVSRDGLGDGLFADWRYRVESGRRLGHQRDFVLNRPDFAGATILLAGRNFGCGSSREHAVWALRDFGIRVIIAESFGRIFHRNCARNGLLAIRLAAEQISRIAVETEPAPQDRRLQVDLEQCEIRLPEGIRFDFDVSESDRHMLLQGLDPIGLTLQHEDAILAFAERDRRARAWAYLP
jgi:3-isopropylmalate/(R)-2-methylmalate dehydratase small subunit